MAKKRIVAPVVETVETEVAPILETTEVTVEDTKSFCPNCENSGRKCSVCGAQG
jgi:hypothetical protein